ncbi:MAG TPA: AAA family ATPase, partial [Patescibacteria group bacterium]|nr:AAA family ATPase [Patescibacteria group bacterium]
MRLNTLTLHGFKSFADKTTFNFTKNFTAIVGPNGSGKSNISDAIRWVLGEQSSKTLRTKQGADVIFGGSDALSRLGMAQVELHLDNSDGRIPLDYTEVVIARKIFRTGESEYRINNAPVRLQDIVMILAKAKFGQKSYAVIGQGMITHFLNATPQ